MGESVRQGKEEKDTDSHRRRFYENMFFREKTFMILFRSGTLAILP